MSWRCYDTCCVPEPETEYTVLSRRYPRRTRAAHACVYCRQPIPAGSACYVVNVLCENQVRTDYRHHACPEQ